MDQLQTIWGWQPALYLFLGGMGAAVFIVAALMHFREGEKLQKTVCIGIWAGMVSLAVGLLCLVTELIHPLRGLMLWQSFSNFTSWMTIGAWLAFCAIVVFFVAAILKTCRIVGKVPALGNLDGKIGNVLAVAGIILGFGVAVYTGILLMAAPGVPLWNTLLLPVLFTVSALDTGVALFEVISAAVKGEEPATASRKGLLRAVVVLVCLELIVLVALLASCLTGAGEEGSWAAAAALSAQTIVSGSLAPYFWGLLVVCGLVLPCVVAVVELDKLRKAEEDAPHASGLAVAGALGALVGGCALRFIIVFAGVHADILSDTASALFLQTLQRMFGA